MVSDDVFTAGDCPLNRNLTWQFNTLAQHQFNIKSPKARSNDGQISSSGPLFGVMTRGKHTTHDTWPSDDNDITCRQLGHDDAKDSDIWTENCRRQHVRSGAEWKISAAPHRARLTAPQTSNMGEHEHLTGTIGAV